MTRTISVNAIYKALGRFVVRFRWAIVVFWLLAAVVTTAALPSIGSEINDNNSAFLKSSEPSIRAADLASPILGQGASGNVTSIPLVAVQDSRRLNAADVASITRLVGLLQQVPKVASVQVAGVSPDVRAVQLRLRARISVSATPDKDKTLVDSLTAQFSRAQPPAGLHYYVTGQIATIVAGQKQSDKQGGEVQLASFVFIILLLLVVFRSLPAALVTLLPAGLALAIAGRLIGALGAGGLQVSSITQILLIVLMLGAGSDYGLFYIFRVREELRAGHDPHAAVERALLRVGESITGSAGTVILALLTLLFASFGLYHDLGIPLAVGMCVMLLIGLTLLPALLAILGRRAFWPAKIVPGEQREGIWGKVASTLVQRPKLTLGVGVCVFLALAAGALGYKAGGFGGVTNPPQGLRRRRRQRRALQALPAQRLEPGQRRLQVRRVRVDEPAAHRPGAEFAAGLGPLQEARRAAQSQRHGADAAAADPALHEARSAAEPPSPPARECGRGAHALQRLPRRRTVRIEVGPCDAVRSRPEGGRAGHDVGDERDPGIRTVVTAAAHASQAHRIGPRGRGGRDLRHQPHRRPRSRAS